MDSMNFPGIYVQHNRTQTKYREVKRKVTNRKGGYKMYWGLLKQFHQMMKTFEYLKLTPKQKFYTQVAIRFQVFFKPMLSIFHTVTNYHTKFICNELDELVRIDSFSKETTLYLFRIIPIWYYTSDKPKTKEDFEIFKK